MRLIRLITTLLRLKLIRWRLERIARRMAI